MEKMEELPQAYAHFLLSHEPIVNGYGYAHSHANVVASICIYLSLNLTFIPSRIHTQ